MIFPTGGIPLAEPQQSHRALVEIAKPEYVLTKITNARQLHDERDETAASYFGSEPAVITTTTVRDDQLNHIWWDEHELDIVSKFGPDYHIPADYSTYEGQSKEKRLDNISDYLEGTLWVDQEIQEQGLDIQVLPLIKAVTDDERERCFAVLEQHPFPGYVFYATQYFTGGEGNKIDELVADVEACCEYTDRPLMLIGLLSPNYLERMPENVVAGTGLNQWRKRIKPQIHDEPEVRNQWNDLQAEVREALNLPRLDTESADVGSGSGGAVSSGGGRASGGESSSGTSRTDESGERASDASDTTSAPEHAPSPQSDTAGED
jgi:hypothetical protein